VALDRARFTICFCIKYTPRWIRPLPPSLPRGWHHGAPQLRPAAPIVRYWTRNRQIGFAPLATLHRTIDRTAMPAGLYKFRRKIRNNPIWVQVSYGQNSMPIPEDIYRTRCYEPDFEQLPWEEDTEKNDVTPCT
jgi:hypothetical protein